MIKFLMLNGDKNGHNWWLDVTSQPESPVWPWWWINYRKVIINQVRQAYLACTTKNHSCTLPDCNTSLSSQLLHLFLPAYSSSKTQRKVRIAGSILLTETEVGRHSSLTSKLGLRFFDYKHSELGNCKRNLCFLFPCVIFYLCIFDFFVSG